MIVLLSHLMVSDRSLIILVLLILGLLLVLDLMLLQLGGQLKQVMYVSVVIYMCVHVMYNVLHVLVCVCVCGLAMIEHV